MATRIVSADDARVTRTMYRGRRYEVRDYFGAHDGVGDDVQGFQVALLTPHGRIEPHFHEVDQYQVVVGGAGSLGRHEVGPGVVHYTDRYTTYGPIDAGAEGIRFFTLRPSSTVETHYMPESRDEKVERSGATFTATADLSLPVVKSAGRYLAETADGARAFELRCAPGAEVRATEALGPGFLLVVAGAVRSAGAPDLPPGTCIWVDEKPAPLGVGGVEGCVLVHLQFRRPEADAMPHDLTRTGQS